MKNLFNVTINKNTQKIESEYKNWIIRQVTKKQEEKLASLGQSYTAAQQRGQMSKWLYLWIRISSTLIFTSLVFFLAMLFMNISKGLESFFLDYLWLEIMFSVGLVSFVLAMVTRIVLKRKEKNPQKNIAEDIFDKIMDTSKQYLNIPQNALNIEILSLQMISKNNILEKSKHKIYNNIVLNAFIEDKYLCFADLYDVIGIPLTYITEIVKIEECYQFKYWHKKDSFTTFEGVKMSHRSYKGYEAKEYYCLRIAKENEQYEICIPSYEVEALKNLLEGRIICK